MPERSRSTLKASQHGKQLIKERCKRLQRTTIPGALDVNEIVLREASKILQPDKNWDNVSAEHYAVAENTLKRFRAAKYRIKASTFKAFCQVLDLNWEDVAENEEDANRDLSEAPAPVNFYGRTKELAELQQSLLQKGCRLVLIHGMGGIGKSALVRHLVDKVADKLFETVENLIGRHSLMSKNTEDISVIYILEPVILKYSNQRFILENHAQISQIFINGIINGCELFITHSFITAYPNDEELNQEQMRRIVQPIQKMLSDNFRSQQQLENALKKVLSLLEDKGLSQGYAYQNISHLISAGKQI
ncbi:MAG: AAA family ATPase [Nostoc sp.]